MPRNYNKNDKEKYMNLNFITHHSIAFVLRRYVAVQGKKKKKLP